MSRDASTLPSCIARGGPPVLIVGGKGGVGKTTTATAAAIRMALDAPTERVLLVSTDPAHNLRDALAGIDAPSNLEVVELDASAEHEIFMTRHGETLKQIASRGTFLSDDEIERFLELSLPGVDELMCFVRIAEWFQEERADRYVIDTAPTGHALRLLGMPTLLEGWLGAIDSLLGKHRYMASVFGGSGGDDVESFIEETTEAFENVAAVWSDKSLCAFLPVFNAESLSISETVRLLDQLEELDIACPELMLNRIVTESTASESTPMAALASRQLTAMAEGAAGLEGRSIFVKPLADTEPTGKHLWTYFDDVAPWSDRPAASEAAERSAPPVRGSITLPTSSGVTLTLLAGKGGVGKTTMSCAVAMATASRSEGRTLLVSTDPAGSLGDALDLEVTADATVVTPNLDAMQLDAERELDALKNEYSEEIDAFLEGMMGEMSLSFDGEALQNLLDLAPTGIDEVMALVRMIEVLDEGQYQSVVIDTAPTGHTLRLLELPALVQAWTEQILTVLVSYENIISLPRVSERLIRLSRGLKKLRTMLGDRDATGLIPVSIPTALSVAETGRLIEGCNRIGVSIRGLIVNQVLPGSSPSAIATLEKIGAGRPIATVELGGDVRGRASLEALGVSLVSTEAGSARIAA